MIENKLGAVGAQLLGVVHLLPLPGSPRYGGSRAAVLEAARRDAEAILAGGMDGFIVENFGDAPFRPGAVEATVVAEMTRITAALVDAAGPDRWVGVNVLRNAAAAALAIAGASGARGIRINVHAGTMFTDQGMVEGRADETLRERRSLGLDGAIALLADVWVKHATPPVGVRLEDAARDSAYRGLADGLIVTGRATGAAAELDRVDAVRRAVPDRPLFVGSGVTADSVAEILARADGVIVGTSIKVDGLIEGPVDRARVERLVAAARNPSRTWVG